VLAPAPQPGQRLHQPLGVPDLHPLGVQPRLDPLADQPAGHRVDVALHPDRAAGIDPQPQPLARLQPPAGQRPQHGQLRGQAALPPAVALPEQLPQERRVGGPVGEVPAAPQHQGLVQGALELVVALLGVPVLVGPAGVDRLAAQAVVLQQRLVAPLERLGIAPRLHGGRQPVGAMHLGHAAQLPQGVLQALAEALVTLRKAQGAGLPVRVGQHEVVDQVREGRAGEGHAQLRAVGEVAGRQPAGLVDLGEEHLLGRPVLGPPLLQPPLQGPQLAVGVAAGVLPLQGLEEGLGLQAGVEGQLLLDPGPGVREGVGPGPPGVLHAYLAGQAAEPPVLARGLLIQARLGGGLPLGQPPQFQATKASDLLVGRHREPPCRWVPDRLQARTEREF